MGADLPLAVLGDVFYLGAVGLILLGVYAVVIKRHLIRVLLGLTLLEAGVNLFLVAVGFRPDAAAPILSGAAGEAMVDPIPQALILTAIVIGVAVLALGLALCLRVYRAYGTLNMRSVARRVNEVVEEPPLAGRLATVLAAEPAGGPERRS